jgi:hypothetical protein
VKLLGHRAACGAGSGECAHCWFDEIIEKRDAGEIFLKPIVENATHLRRLPKDAARGGHRDVRGGRRDAAEHDASEVGQLGAGMGQEFE